MRLSYIAACCLALATNSALTASLPETDAHSIQQRAVAAGIPRSDILAPDHALEKRKGGGGGGKGGGGSSSGGKGGSSSSGSSSSGRTSSSSNVGGSTAAGSGPARSYGGVYGGGASVPYKSGSKSGKGLLAGGVIGLGAAALIMPGLWLYSVYPYAYHNPYRFVNESVNNATNPNGFNQSLPVVCLCQENNPCGCDENEDQTYLKALVGNGSYSGLNKTLVTVSDVNGTQSLVINGTLPNGTTAPGGTDDAGIMLSAGQYGGYWVMGLIVVYTVAFI
ncbi:hypothetical protein P280DRAFT_491872 [Massarina eburnea CBS 473.64]|uniref:DUF7732 domain-containing protein n=1 Tax=Massarina eburnea CBS 473.64 TaxID=1395130 RepID=A0A6A6RW83_9PLEO|nr:hypothetical protein P280DRAFT_491872 [Massarina eburnea CBS 473.64]